MLAIVNFAARSGLGAPPSVQSRFDATSVNAKNRAHQTAVRGDTYADWYLRRHGYILIARNFTSPGIQGEIDIFGYDGPTLAFVEVKTRAIAETPSSPRSS